MKAHITITDDHGAVFEGEVDLAPVGVARGARRRTKLSANAKAAKKAAPVRLDFTRPERAFIKTYARALSGPRKFVLLVAYLAKGQVGKEVQLNEVHKHWNKMTALLEGKFNRFYSNTAKDDGWVDTKKKGVYVLTASWKEAVEV